VLRASIASSFRLAGAGCFVWTLSRRPMPAARTTLILPVAVGYWPGSGACAGVGFSLADQSPRCGVAKGGRLARSANLALRSRSSLPPGYRPRGVRSTPWTPGARSVRSRWTATVGAPSRGTSGPERETTHTSRSTESRSGRPTDRLIVRRAGRHPPALRPVGPMAANCPSPLRVLDST
jgi:hypothetical protein